LLQSLLVAFVGIAFFNFINSIDVGWLDLTRPVTEKPVCMTRWILRHETSASAVLNVDLWRIWANYRLDNEAWLEEHKCRNSTSVLAAEGEHCHGKDLSIKLRQTQEKVGMPIGADYRYVNDYLEFFAAWLFSMSVLLWVFITFHDLALTSVHNRIFVYDLPGIMEDFPCVRRLGVMLGLKLIQRLACGRRYSRLLCVLLMPFLIVWQAMLFLFFIGPLSTIVFLTHPIRFSRVMVFLTSVALAIIGLIITILAISSWADVDKRQAYAITWYVNDCRCGCSYPMSRKGFANAGILGITIIYKQLMLAFRALKGLRRSNWATLLTVLFPVPLNVYSVRWTRPDGSPIQHRRKGEPVQGEMAFDPFALMDEQPESEHMQLTLRPTFVSSFVKAASSSAGSQEGEFGEFLDSHRLSSSGSSLSSLSDKERRAELSAAWFRNNDTSTTLWKKNDTSGRKSRGKEYIGCCGFPCIHQQIKDEEDTAGTCELADVQRMKIAVKQFREEADAAMRKVKYLEERLESVSGEPSRAESGLITDPSTKTDGEDELIPPVEPTNPVPNSTAQPEQIGAIRKVEETAV